MKIIRDDYEILKINDEDDFLDYISPIIREQLDIMSIYGISASEVDEIGRNIYAEIDGEYTEEDIYNIVIVFVEDMYF